MDFSELYRRYAGDVFRFSLFLSGNRATAEDLTAETFARALVGRDGLRVDTVKAYLFAIARNLYRDVRSRDRRLVPIDAVTPQPDPSPTQDVVTGDRQRLETVLSAIQQLPDGEREALVLAIQKDVPYERIAAILGCSIVAVKVRVHRARARLRSILDTKEPV
jgi:RNA polymerase sigma-70 factor (ECF subfamily)